MATSTLDKDDVSVETLSNMFKKGLNINDDELENNTGLSSNSDEFQHKVRKGILLMEDSTRLVSLLDLFSRNETVSEVPTEHLKYFLLPAVLGNLHSKLVDQDRLEIIKIIEAYYLDYLRRIRDYGIANISYLDKLKSKNSADDQPKRNQSSKPDLAKMNRERDEKIQRFKESKILETSLKELKLAIEKPSCDDEVLRDYYLKLIRRFTFIALDELTSFETEKEILQHMAKLREESGGTLPALPPKDKQPRRPLKPIIITRDALQKEVFGMGYKNLPVFSIEEFYDQRVRDGWYANAGAPSLLDGTANKEEEEIVQKEILEENDDPVELERKRNFDNYKDEHKRGEGNRHNKG